MSEESIDVKEVLERVQDDKELLLELFDIFQQDYAEKRRNLNDFIARKDFEQIKALAHSLKGASGNISAKKLNVLFVKLEQLGKSNDLTNINPFLKDLDEQYGLVQAHIVQLKKDFKK